MLTEPDAKNLIERFSRLELRYAEQYGPYSQARVFFLVEELVTLRFALLEASGAGMELLRQQRHEVLTRVQHLYDTASLPELAPPPVRVFGSNPKIIEFDRALYTARYASAAEAMRDEVVYMEQWEPELQSRPHAYMYVVDDQGRMRIWTRPFRMGDLVLGRNRAKISGVPVAHPMLVPERLQVIAAGEITPVISGGITSVVANLKSGHFRPPPSAAAAVRSACAKAIGLDPADCDVLTMPFAASPAAPATLDRSETSSARSRM
ncbi:hypothetical protein [Streptomyces sp. NPDC102282]|uniref:hypothetical protein n=1 Tax=Streptomyces sp. NPDC102282 TaxID=3366154 RepID=UPI0037F86C7B